MSILTPEWTALLYLIAAVCFILALKGLSSPQSARRGNALGAAGALVAVITVFLSVRLENIPLILAAIAVGSAIAVPIARRVQMTQMPQLVALFNGVGGGAAALVAVLELGHTDDAWVRLAVVFTMLVGAVSFAGSAVTVAKLQELITTRPVTFPGMRWLMAIVLIAAARRLRLGCGHRFLGVGDRRAAARPRNRSAAGASGRRRRCAHRDLAAQRVHRTRRRGIRHRARQRAARRRRNAGWRQRNDSDAGHGLGDGQKRHRHPVRRVPRRIDRRIDRGERTGRCGRRPPRMSRSSSGTRNAS